MENDGRKAYTAFEGHRLLATGDLINVALEAKAASDREGAARVLLFRDDTGKAFDLNYRGTPEEVRERIAREIDDRREADREPSGPKGPGRPRLGVVAREVTLLPRHWEWLNDQPGGASVALRKLVEEARKANEGPDRVRKAREAAYHFLLHMGGDLPGFEEATRSLFAGHRERFDEQIEGWPADVRDHARKLAAPSFDPA
ncbi:DUF2239 family protein [Tundrisphaera lichenicola]|uniref:DUF2239 family protein n=1 Tax=Tundrisphaera lichenicola TaxID=2029860 RepID=UPI003EBD063D